MDVDDLFGAFDGDEKVNDVHEPEAEPSFAPQKRKAVQGDRVGGGSQSDGSKRQALHADEVAKRGLDLVGGTRVEGSVALKEGEESSTVREDGTLVKSVRTNLFAPHLYVYHARALCQQGF